MTDMAFVHLRTHTEFSVADGTLRIADAVDLAAGDGQAALAITDLSNLFGAVKLYSAARKSGVKPIIGADLWIEATGGEKAPSRLVLLVQTKQGYLNLCELISRAWLRHEQRAQACVKWEWLTELNEGLIALSGAEMGAVGQALIAGDVSRAEAAAHKLDAIFGQRFYIELQRAGLPGNEAHVRKAAVLAAKLGLPVVATDAPGLREALPPDYPWRARPGDAAGFARGLQRALDERASWPVVTRRAGEFARERFDIATMLAAYARLYRSACK